MHANRCVIVVVLGILTSPTSMTDVILIQASNTEGSSGLGR